MTDAMMTFTNVVKDFGDGPVLNGLNLTIPAHQLFVLVGPSGSGKTTALKLINRLHDYDSGCVTYAGKPVQSYDCRELRWQIGYVLQQIALFPHLTVRQNINLIPEMKRLSKTSMRQRGDELLHAVDLDPQAYADRLPAELSGGEAQRVGIVRALAADPPTVLMDEPFSALDPISRVQLQDLLLHLQTQYHKTIVFVTHDMREALKLGDQIALMTHGQVVQQGTPDELLHHPKTRFVTEFFANAQQPDAQASLRELVAAGLTTPGDLPGSLKLTIQSRLEEALSELTAGRSVTITTPDGPMILTPAATLRYLLPRNQRTGKED